MKNTKTKLISSFTVLLICFAMLIGSTFAWFTDSASTGVNKIQSGNLDVEIVDSDGNVIDNLVWKTLDGRNPNEIFWEPGCTYELQDFYIKNKGNLDLKYKVTITGIQGDAELNRVIDWTINNADQDTDYVLRAGATSELIKIKGHMQETADNTYRNKSIDGIQITVDATQSASEYDSFNNTYDQGATYADGNGNSGNVQVGVQTYDELVSAIALLAQNNLTLDIGADITVPENETWTPISVNGAEGNGVLTINGNEHKITGLNAPLIANTWAGRSGVIVNQLTLESANIVEAIDDQTEDVGVGAFIGVPSASEQIILNDCHLLNSIVKGGHWCGGLIGVGGGYNGTDGPVFENIKIINCSVKNSTIESKGSVGSIFGHACWDPATRVEITNCTVEGNTIKSTGSSDEKAGSLMGTVGCAGYGSLNTTLGVNDEYAGVYVTSTQVSNNTVTSNNTSISTVCGRQGNPTGRLVIDGIDYFSAPSSGN